MIAFRPHTLKLFPPQVDTSGGQVDTAGFPAAWTIRAFVQPMTPEAVTRAGVDFDINEPAKAFISLRDTAHIELHSRIEYANAVYDVILPVERHEAGLPTDHAVIYLNRLQQQPEDMHD